MARSPQLSCLHSTKGHQAWALAPVENLLAKLLNGLTEVLGFMLFLRTPRYQPYNNPGQQNLANLVRLQWKLAYEQLHPIDEVRQAISRIVNPKGQNTHLARIRSLEESHILITDELRANFER